MDTHQEFSNRVRALRAKVLQHIHLYESVESGAGKLEPLLVDELATSLEELQVAEEELLQQNEELITSRHRLEAEHQRYQDLFNFAPEGYLITDLNGKILEANRSACLLLNIRLDFLVGKPIAQYVVHGERRRIRKIISTLVNSTHRSPQGSVDPRLLDSYPEFDVTLAPRNSVPFSAAVTLAMGIISGKPILRWSIRNINQQKAAQNAIQESEARFRKLAESSSVAVFLLDGKRIQYANQAASRITGYEIDHFQGIEFTGLIHPEYLAGLLPLLVGAGAELAPGAEHMPDTNLRKEIQILSKSGDECWVDLTIGKSVLENRTVTIVTAYDITTRVLAETAQKALLRRLVDLQEDERQRISRELHDQMGQSLTALNLGLKALEDQENDPDRLLQFHKLKTMVGELGQKIHRVAIELRPAALDDLGLGVALTNFAQKWSERSQVPVDIQISGWNDEPIPAMAATAVYRIVQETLTNVAKHAQATEVSLVLNRQSKAIRVIIEDNGVGFNPEETLVPPYRYRLGILGMVERANSAGGTLLVETEPGRGTTIFVHIPLVVSSTEKGARTE